MKVKENRRFSGVVAKLMPLSLIGEAYPEVPPTIYVDAFYNGKQSNGSIETPYPTIEEGIRVLQPGGTLLIRSGIYEETITITTEKSGSARVGQTTIKAFPKEKPVISGKGDSRITIINGEYLTIEGLTLDGGSYGINYYTDDHKPTTGLDNLFIIDNVIRNIDGFNSLCVYNTITDTTDNIGQLRNVVIANNHVCGGRSGDTETIVINGGIDGFTISGNHVHNNNNIGIDVIGFENGLNQHNRAHNGKVFDNVVYGTTVINNQTSAYWEENEDNNALPFDGIYNRCSNGIYVDGGYNVEIYHNFIFDNDLGIEIACERVVDGATMVDVSVYGVNVHDNIIAATNGWAGICFGGYDGNLAYTKDCVIANNILYGNKVAIGVQKSQDNIIKNNIIVAGQQGIEFMPFINNLPNEGDPFTVDGLVVANEFATNIWFNSENIKDWFDHQTVQTKATRQYDQQLFIDTNPLEEPEKGDFRVKKEYQGNGTSYKLSPYLSALFVEYIGAYRQLMKACLYLESKVFVFAEVAKVGNLNGYLTACLKAAGYSKAEVLYTIKTVKQNKQGNARYSDTAAIDDNGTSDEGSIVIKAIGVNNGNINQALLEKKRKGSEYAYLVQVICRYDDGHSYTSEATESDLGGVRVIVK